MTEDSSTTSFPSSHTPRTAYRRDVENLRVEAYAAPEDGLQPRVMVSEVTSERDGTDVVDHAALTPKQAQRLAGALLLAADEVASFFPGPCPAWCQEAAAGHRFEPDPTDYVHSSDPLSLPLQLPDPVRFEKGPGQVELFPVSVDVQLRRQDREVEPTVSLVIDQGTATEVDLSLAEAGRLSGMLAALLQQAQGKAG